MPHLTCLVRLCSALFAARAAMVTVFLLAGQSDLKLL
jgi:hypothetical protein